MRNIGRYLGDSGAYRPALELSRQITDAHRESAAFGPEHSATLTARASLAHWTGEAGDAAGTRDQYAALLPVSERILGPEHPDTLADRANLAHGLSGRRRRAFGPVGCPILGTRRSGQALQAAPRRGHATTSTPTTRT
jgi:hypothetical protein